MADNSQANHPFTGHVRHLNGIIPLPSQIFDLLSAESWYPFPLRKGKNSSRSLCNHHIQDSRVGQILTKWLQQLFKQVNIEVSIKGMFGNYYPDGEATLPHHQDQYDADVISLSFGATRLFHFKSTSTNRVAKPTFYLESGDILIFDQHMNKDFTHGIPLQKQIREPRINITCFVQFKGDPFTADFDSISIPTMDLSVDNGSGQDKSEQDDQIDDGALAQMLQMLEFTA